MEVWPQGSSLERRVIEDSLTNLLKNYRSCGWVSMAIYILSKKKIMAKNIAEVLEVYEQPSAITVLEYLSKSLYHENMTVRSLSLRELKDFVKKNQWLLLSLTSKMPSNQLLRDLINGLLVNCVKFGDIESEIVTVAAECLGLVGAIDPARCSVEPSKHEFIVVQNFQDSKETKEFVVALINYHLVPSFRAATDTKAQSLLAFSMQELLKICGLSPKVIVESSKPQQQSVEDAISVKQWQSFTTSARVTLTPLLSSMYVLSRVKAFHSTNFPIFTAAKSYRTWIQDFTLAMLAKAGSESAEKLFSICSKIIQDQDLSIANFILPPVLLNVTTSGTKEDRSLVLGELKAVLEAAADSVTLSERYEYTRLATETVFNIIEYFNKWMRSRKRLNFSHKTALARRNNKNYNVDQEEITDLGISRVEEVLSVIPNQLIAEVASVFNSDARALFYWELHIRETRNKASNIELRNMYIHLQALYSKMEVADGFRGVSSKISDPNLDQQILAYETAGQWDVAETCYQIKLSDIKHAEDEKVVANYLDCLRQGGKRNDLITYFQSLPHNFINFKSCIPIVMESVWMTGNWAFIDRSKGMQINSYDFDHSLALCLFDLKNGEITGFSLKLNAIRKELAQKLSKTGHEGNSKNYAILARLHCLSDLEHIVESHKGKNALELSEVLDLLEKRFTVLQPNPRFQQLNLAIRRTGLLSNHTIVEKERVSAIPKMWLQASKVAMKFGNAREGYMYIMEAEKFHTSMASIAKARWWWKQGQKLQAINTLDAGFKSGLFPLDFGDASAGQKLSSVDESMERKLSAKAALLLVRWKEEGGQSSHQDLIKGYTLATNIDDHWESSQYYLGHYINKLYDHEEAKVDGRKKRDFQTGEYIRAACICYLKALYYGTKYIFQTLPKLLTLWLDFGVSVDQIQELIASDDDGQALLKRRLAKLGSLNESIRRSVGRLPAYIFLIGLSQILSRICHPNQEVFNTMEAILSSVLSKYPQQALWSMMAVTRSKDQMRAKRGNLILSKLKEDSRDNHSASLRKIVSDFQKLSNDLLRLCNMQLVSGNLNLSLSKDFQFTTKVTPGALVMPLQTYLTPEMPDPNITPPPANHQPFSQGSPCIYSK